MTLNMISPFAIHFVTQSTIVNSLRLLLAGNAASKREAQRLAGRNFLLFSLGTPRLVLVGRFNQFEGILQFASVVAIGDGGDHGWDGDFGKEVRL